MPHHFPMHAQVRPIPAQDRSLRVLELLSHASLFRGLSPDELGRIAAGTRELRLERGELVFQRGDPSTGFHIVAVGQVKLSLVTRDGAEKVIEIIGPGMSFGEAVMFMEKPYMVSATALADCLLLHVGRPALFAELDRDPRLARRMLAGLSMRLHMMVRDVEAMTLQSAAHRVIGYLLRLGDEGAAGSITLPAQKSLVASRLNLTPEYFSRILHHLAARELIRIDGRDIAILDIEGLRAYGNEEAG